MKILLYSKLKHGAGKLLENVVETVVPKERMEIHRTVDSLSRRLRQPANDLNIAILLTATGEDLLSILSIIDLLEDLRIILVLPDRDSDTISKGHRLRPRFLTYADSDLAEVGAVLERMLGVQPI